MITITHSTGTIYPTTVDGFESTREGTTVVHPIIGRANPDITIRPAGLRVGSLALVFGSTPATEVLTVVDGIVQSASIPAQDPELASKEAEDLHAAGGVFTLNADGRPTLDFSYVPHGNITRRLDPQTRDVWLVEIEFQEVTT